MAEQTQHCGRGQVGQQGLEHQGSQSGESQQGQHQGQPRPGQGQQGLIPSGKGKGTVGTGIGGTQADVAPASFVTGGFANTLSKILPYFGTSRERPQIPNPSAPGTLEPENMALGVKTGFANILIPQGTDPATGLPRKLSTPIVAGYVRIKMFGGGTPTGIVVSGNDGTNTDYLYAASTGNLPGLTATIAATFTIPFESELNCTQFAVQLTGMAAPGEADIEISGSTGAV